MICAPRPQNHIVMARVRVRGRTRVEPYWRVGGVGGAVCGDVVAGGQRSSGSRGHRWRTGRGVRSGEVHVRRSGPELGYLFEEPTLAKAKATKKGKEAEKERAYGTPDSHVVPHRSTDEACSGLTAQFGRDTVRFTEYGRRHSQWQSS